MLKLKLAKRKHEPNKFRYVPRYLKEDNEIKLGTKRNTEFGNKYSAYDRRNAWVNALEESHTKGNYIINRNLIIILSVLVFIVLWIFDFDISFFWQ